MPIIAGGVVVGFIWRGKKVRLRKGMDKKIPVWIRKVGTENYILDKERKKAMADQLEAKGSAELRREIRGGGRRTDHL